MEFLRLGSSIPGSYWGCCCVDVIQNFNVNPDAPASIQIVNGDEASPVLDDSGRFLFAGPTYRDIFWQRLRFGTFDRQNMPNHAFIAVITESQLSQTYPKMWLAILKEAGFEFIRAVSNSVYAGSELYDPEWDDDEPSPNYIFGLFRNIGANPIANPYKPPLEWTELPDTVPELWMEHVDSDIIDIKMQRQDQLKIWEEHQPKPLLTEEEVIAAGAEVTYAGLRSEYPQETKASREAKQAIKKASAKPVDPFVTPVSVQPVDG